MSGPRLSIIPARAATDRALKPRDLQVLCVLGRHTDDLGWCRKSQVKMADEMGCARSTVFEAIERLVKAGYLERHEQIEDNGRDSPHVYRVILDPKHGDPASVVERVSEADSGPEMASPPAGISAPPAGPEPAPPAGPGPAPKNDPLRTTHQNEERERGREDGEDRKKIEARGWALLKDWPDFAGMPKAPAMLVWRAMPPEDRDKAERRFPGWLALLKAQKKSHIPAPSTYFRQKLFEDVGDPSDAAEPTTIEAKPFGPVWGAVVLRELLTAAAEPSPSPPSAFMAELLARDDEQGRAERLKRQAAHGWPKVNFWLRQADSRKGFTAPAADKALAALMEPVPVETGLFGQWREEFARRGWPWLPDPGGMRVVFFPAGGPGGLQEFEAAVRGDGNDAGRCEAAE